MNAATSQRRPREWAALAACAAVLVYWQIQYAGYIKDDAFISMRYARNLAEGMGLVFNPGDRLEGYTNFLWVLLLSPAFLLGANPVVWAKVLGCAAGLLGVVLSHGLARHLLGDRPDPAALLAPILWVLSPSVVLWSMGGLEPTLMACLCSGSLWVTMRALERPVGEAVPSSFAPWQGGLLALAVLLRPDSHAIVLVVAGAFCIDVVRRRSLGAQAVDPGWLRAVAIFLAVAVPYHLFRRLYFGDWLPNTYYVKAAAGPEVWKSGLSYAGTLLGFAANPGAFALALLALILPAPRGASRLVAGAAVLGFLLYLVKIGRDEMKWFRLYLPVFPLLLALAAAGFGRILAAIPPRVRAGLSGVLLASSAWGAWKVAEPLTAGKADWHGHYLQWSEDSFGEMGRYVASHSAPGDKVVFQDMGGAPFAGGQQVWLDTIGILNRFVAHELAAAQLNPFLRAERARTPGGSKAVNAVDRRIRDHMLEQDPRWVAFVAYVNRDQKGLARRVKDADGDAVLLHRVFAGEIASNSHARGIAKDARFLQNYRLRRVWRRNQEYWLVLYERDPLGVSGEEP